MTRTILAVLTLLFVAGPAPAVQVRVMDFMANANAIASQLALNLSLPEGGLANYWPAEVEDIADLPPFVATIKDPAKLNARLGEEAKLAKGDFVVLNAVNNAGGYGFGAAFFSRGEGWDMPLATDALTSAEYGKMMSKAGICLANPGLGTGSVLQFATITDPAAFGRESGYEGEVVKGQAVMLSAGPSGTTARIIRALSNPIQGFGAAKGVVHVIMDQE